MCKCAKENNQCNSEEMTPKKKKCNSEESWVALSQGDQNTYIHTYIHTHTHTYIYIYILKKKKQNKTIVEVITNDTSFIRIHLIERCKSRKTKNGGDGKVERNKIF